MIRSVSGIVFVSLSLGCLLAGPWTYALYMLVLLVTGLIEFYRLGRESDILPFSPACITAGVVLFVLSLLVAAEYVQATGFLMLVPFVLLIPVTELYRKKKHPLGNIATGLIGLLYVALPLSMTAFLVFRHGEAYSPRLLIVLLGLIWLYDSGAYLFGVSLGKHRLFERISPRKSWEGTLGGALVAVGGAGLLARFIPLLSPAGWMILAIPVVVSATLGDLTESLMKRQFGKKDSGQLIPGHGGLLDRFDSFLFAVPVYFLLLELIGGKI